MNEMIVVDLPSLQFIELGEAALWGCVSDSCSLIMRSMNDMILNDLLCRSSNSSIHNF